MPTELELKTEEETQIILRTDYYNYILCDPRKEKYIIKLINVLLPGEPFYVGRGCDCRKTEHLREVRNNLEDEGFYECGNKEKKKKIREIIKSGHLPIIFLVKQNISFQESVFSERFLIRVIGCADKKKGPLTNLTDGGEGTEGYRHTPETKEKFSLQKKGKKRRPGTYNYLFQSTYQLSLSGEVIEHFESLTAAMVKTGIDKSSIMNICKKKGESKTAGGFCWCYVEDLEQRQKGLSQFTLDGEFIKEWDDSIQITKELKIDGSLISPVCTGRTKTCAGFGWCYLNDKEIYQEKLKKNPLKVIFKKLKVKQFDINHNFISEYNSLEETSRNTNISVDRIRACCKGIKMDGKAGGFFFEYSDKVG